MNARDAAIDCEAFAADAGELATGTLDEARSRALLAHAATCPSCRALLDATVAVVDELLLLAPSAEPPAGFEAGAVAALRGEDDGGDGRRRRTRPRRLASVAAAVAAVAVFGAGTALGSRVGGDGGGDDPGGGTTAIVAAAGAGSARSVERVGSVAAKGGRLVVRLDAGPDWPAVVTCELRRAGGGGGVDAGWVPVATWPLQPGRGGVWAVELEGDLADAGAGAGEMRLVGAGGEVVGQAFLT